MNDIPSDAIHWDSGDWIDWHRHAEPLKESPCAAPSVDPRARLHTLLTRMLQSARTYLDLTGGHLPIYRGIAKIHAILAFDLPCVGEPGGDQAANIQIITLPPTRANDIVTIELSRPFQSLVAVRIDRDFTLESRMVNRAELPDQREGTVDIRWSDLPPGV